MDAISIVLIDDHPLMIEAVSTLLKKAGGFEVVGLGTTATDLVGFCERTHPQVAIVDPDMSEDVYQAMADAIKVSPSTKIVAFTSATGIDSAIRALDRRRFIGEVRGDLHYPKFCWQDCRGAPKCFP